MSILRKYSRYVCSNVLVLLSDCGVVYIRNIRGTHTSLSLSIYIYLDRYLD